MDRKIILLCAGAIPLGLAGGYAWSAITAPAARTSAPPRGTMQQLPASPEERPAVLDKEWAQQADDGAVAYSGCNEVRTAGRAPLDARQPGYSKKTDGDGDGVACEPIRGH
jgi:hypothetical protein